MNVFVYGTLKPGESNYQAYCSHKVIAIRQAYTWGELYHLPSLGYPAMTAGKSKVKGFLLTFMDESVLPYLDELESFYPQRSPEENEYNRQRISVCDWEDNWLGEAWCYVMKVELVQKLGGILIASGWWATEL